jgi:NAD dependent epimerase/dehydratase family enzyme
MWQMHVGAFFLRTEPKLMLKSRWAYPKRLRESGFVFDFPDWDRAVTNLVGSP